VIYEAGIRSLRLTREGIPKMPKRFAASTVALIAMLMCSTLARSQGAAPRIHVDGWQRPVQDAVKGGKAAPARPHDISGIWEPAAGWRDGVQATGPKAVPSDGKPEHELPYTPLGLEKLKANKPGFGVREVPAAEVNDPVDFCEPQGFPREDLYELRALQILQTERQAVILYEFNQVWRTIWIDGRELPKDFEEPRWYGYSAAKWVDDYTLVVQTAGIDERSWLDNVGRPHSDALRVEERFHRVDHDTLELTVTIDDPKIYTKPWIALNKYPLRLQQADFDIREMICSPSETADYNKQIADPAVTK
jgi:hypothetical protein